MLFAFMERTTQNPSYWRISRKVYSRLMRFFVSLFYSQPLRKGVVMKAKYKITALTIFLCMLLGIFFASSAYAIANIITESESNDTYSSADITYDDYDNYGYIASVSDRDWWKITFISGGIANFWLGNIPIDCNYELHLYASNGTTLLGSSLNLGNSNELVTFLRLSQSA